MIGIQEARPVLEHRNLCIVWTAQDTIVDAKSKRKSFGYHALWVVVFSRQIAAIFKLLGWSGKQVSFSWVACNHLVPNIPLYVGLSSLCGCSSDAKTWNMRQSMDLNVDVLKADESWNSFYGHDDPQNTADGRIKSFLLYYTPPITNKVRDTWDCPGQVGYSKSWKTKPTKTTKGKGEQSRIATMNLIGTNQIIKTLICAIPLL